MITNGETPIRAELRRYFREVLKPARSQQEVQSRRRVQLSRTGEVLTSDEMVQRIEQAEVERLQDKKREGERSEGEVCKMKRPQSIHWKKLCIARNAGR